MAASIDERIVAMSFENQVFEQRINQTLTSLGKLDTAVKNIHGSDGLENIEKSGNKVSLKAPLSALDKLREKLGRSGQGADQGLGEIEKAGNKVTLEGPNRALDKTQQKMDQLSAGKTFSDIERAADGVTLNGISKAVQAASSQFSVLENAASVAIGGITANAAMKGASFAKSFALGPVTDGLDEYKTNLGSIQTILANTEGQKVSGLDEVNKHLDELNTYSDQTIYNFSEMAKNIGTFTAAGVDMDKSTQSIKGIANLAAVSGSNSQQASTAMYQLSQAISSGRVGLQDWNSVVNAGMGGAVFQKALLRTADNMGTVEKGALKIDKATGKATVNGESFRESIQAKPGRKSWLTDEVLVQTLGQLTGDMTDAQLAAQGFSAEQIKAIQKQAQTAKAAATEVKTLPQVFDVARETIGSGWSQTFKLIFGDFEQSKKTFTAMSTFINDWINKVSDARNNMLGEWSKLGGRAELLSGLKQAFTDVILLLKPIKEAFRDIFPAKTGKDLFDLTKGFHELMVDLRPSPAVMSTIYNVFRIFFDVLDIGWHIIKGVAGVVGELLGVVSKGQGGFAKFVYGVSRFVDSAHDALVNGGALKKFFEGLGEILKKPVELIGKAAGAIKGLFGDSGNDVASLKAKKDEFEKFGKVLTPIERLVNGIKGAWEKLTDAFGQAKSALEPWFSSFVEKISGLGQTIGDALGKLKFDDIMKGINTGLFAGLILLIKNAFGKGGGVLDEVSETLGSVQKLLGGVTNNLENMQKKVQAQLILAIAAAVIALAGGVFILSTIDGPALAKSMAAVAIGLGELGGALKLMSAGMGKTGILLLPFIAAGLIGVAIASTILAGALKIFGSMSWEEIGKGLTAMGGSLGVIAGALRLMPPGPQLIIAAGALFVLGGALIAIGTAVKIMGSLNWEQLGKGLFGVVEVLGFIVLGMSKMPPNMLITAASLLVLSFALVSLAGAVKAMGAIDVWSLGKGLFGISIALGLIGLAMYLFPPTMAASAAGLFIVGAGLVLVAKAVEILGNVGIWGLIKGIGALALILIELAVGMYLMVGTLPGAVAMLAAAAAIAVLAPAIALLGNLKFTTILKGILAIALALGTIAIVGLVAAPALAALGIALIPLGLGFLLVAGAAKLFASAMALLSESGQKGVAAFLVAITGFIAILPGIVISFIKGLISIVDEVQKLAPKVVVALGKILETVIAFIAENAPKLAVAIGILVDSIILVLGQNVPKLIAAGVSLLKGLLDGISQNIAAVTLKVAEIIIKFLAALRASLPKLIEAGSKTLRAFLDGVGSRFGEIANSVGNLIVKFIAAVSNQQQKIVTAAATMMGKFVAAIATYGPTLVTEGAKAIIKFLEGLGQQGPEIIQKGVDAAEKLLNGIADGLVDLADVGFNAIISFLNGLEDAIRANSQDLIDAGLGVGDAIMDGIRQALFSGKGPVKKALEAVFKAMPGWAKKVLGIKSPSKIFHAIGRDTLDGYVQGVAASVPKVKKSTEGIGKSSTEGMVKGLMSFTKDIDNASLGMINSWIAKIKGSLGINSPSEVFRDIGMNVNRGFKNGLLGSRDDVLSAFDDMNSSLIDKIRDLRGQVEEGNNKLADLHKQQADKLAEISKLRSEKKPDKSAIADAIKESEDLARQIDEESVAVNQNGKALTAARGIRKSLTGSMHDEKMELLVLKDTYEALNKDLDEANDRLQKAKDAQSKYQDQYNQPIDISTLVSDAMADADLTEQERQDKLRKEREDAEKKSRINQVELYKNALKEQIAATVKYQETLAKLRAMHLDDRTFQMLADKGLEGQDLANQILASGQSGIDAINQLDAQMLQKSTDIATQLTNELYQGGISAAQGLVDGIKAKQDALTEQMKILADAMVNQIKSKLKIKSPSQIFAEIGQFTVKGLAQGLQDTGEVEGAVVKLGSTMTDALASVVDMDMDSSPVITPVLDISQLRKDVKGLPDLADVIPITAATSYSQASAASQEVSASQQAALEAAAAAAKPSVEYTQNNYSPESLNDVEIYRKTRNQIGQLKSALGVPA